MTPTDLAGPAVPPPGPASATDVLDGAAALLRQGWVRGALMAVVDGKLCYCLVGAIQASTAGPNGAMDRAAYRAVQDELRWRGEELSLSRFNDLYAESVDDVLAVIEAAKARLS